MANDTVYDAMEGCSTYEEHLEAIIGWATAHKEYAILADARCELVKLPYQGKSDKISYEEQAELDSKCGQIHREMGDLYHSENRFDEAAEQYISAGMRDKGIELYQSTGNVEALGCIYEISEEYDMLFDLYINNNDFEGAFRKLDTITHDSEKISWHENKRWGEYISKCAYRDIRDQLSKRARWNKGMEFREDIEFTDLLRAAGRGFSYDPFDYRYLKNVSKCAKATKDPELIQMACDLAALEGYLPDDSKTFFREDSTYYNAMAGNISSIERFVMEAASSGTEYLQKEAFEILYEHGMNDQAIEFAREHMSDIALFLKRKKLKELGALDLVAKGFRSYGTILQYAKARTISIETKE